MPAIIKQIPLKQILQIQNSEAYDDNKVGVTELQTDATSLQDDLNAIRTQLKKIVGDAYWYSEPANSLSSLTAGAGGLSPAVHKSLDTLVHNISESSFIELIRTDGKISSVVIWDSPSMLLKIRDFTITRVDDKVSSIVTNQYNESGNIVEILTQNINRDSNQAVSSITNIGA